MGKLLHEVAPLEVSGRDSIARFAAQMRAAAYVSLSLLKNGADIDCVFCDFHEDYVTRRVTEGKALYDFFQVKTKEKVNYQWTLLDIFCILKKGKQDFERIAGSFAGKLLFHTVQFGESCRTVTFQTNIQVNDEVLSVVTALEQGEDGQKHAKLFFENFREIFPDASEFDNHVIEASLRKLRVEAGSTILDIDGKNFAALTKDAIYTHSEVELSYQEFYEIIIKLLALVEKKSFTRIRDVDETKLIDAAGITLDDLLDVLAISREGYKALVAGGDLKALRNASIIQRKFREAGVSEDMVAFFCRAKVAWDEWLRAKRHVVLEFDLNRLLATVLDAAKQWISTGGQLKGLYDIAETFQVEPKVLESELTTELRLGAILSELVRNQR